MKKYLLSRGFTMIEFLVMLVIIAILATLGGSAYSNSLKRARNAQRIGDMKTVQKGFELYHTLNNSYDLTGTSMECEVMRTDTAVFPAGAPEAQSGEEYVYDCNDTVGVETYCVCAELDDVSEGNSFDGACTYEDDPLDADTDRNFYCVNNLQ